MQSGTQTEVCSIMCDIGKIARKKKSRVAKKLREFCMKHHISNLTIEHNPTEVAVALVWAHFPTSLGVKFYGDGKTVPTWNEFSQDMVEATFNLSRMYVVDQGWLICTCIPEHFPIVHSAAESYGFSLHRSWNVLTEVGYIREDPYEEVVLCLLYLLMLLEFECSNHLYNCKCILL